MNKTIKPLLTIFSISTLLLLFLGVVGGCTKVEVSTGGGGTDIGICVGQDTLDCSETSNDGDDDNTSNDGDDDNTDTETNTETDSGNETTTN